MYAIVEIAGQQFKVEEGKKIYVHRLDAEKDKKIRFDQVLLVEDEGKITVGEPVVKNSFVEGKVLDNVRGDKVIVFKKKKKKGYRVRNGHRQNFTQIEIISINDKTTQKKPAAKKEAAAITEEPSEEKKTGVKKTTIKKESAEVKKPAEKKSADKKPASKKDRREKIA
jgi:large subunit ribosomal protein L21